MVNVIFVTKNKIVGTVVDEKKGKILNSYELGWDINTLDISIGTISEKMRTKKFRILLDDFYSYVLRVTIPNNIGVSDERRLIAEKIREKIPEVLQNYDWDYKEMQFKLSAGEKNDNLKEREVIVFSPVKYISEILSKAIFGLGLDIEAIEPVELALTRDTNPLIGIALKTDINGSDRDVLNISLEKKNDDRDFKDILNGKNHTEINTSSNDGQKSMENDEQKGSSEGTGKRKIFATLALLVVIGGFLAILGFQIYKSFFEKKSESTVLDSALVTSTPTPKSSPTPEPTEFKADFSAYSVLIKNGSGLPGEAQYVSDLLEDIGFSEFGTGNADSYNYLKTEIVSNPDIPEIVLEGVIEVLREDYDIATTSAVDTERSFDIVIVVGKRK